MSGLWDRVGSEEFVTQIVELATAWGLKVLGALAVVVAGWLLAGWMRRLVKRGLARSRMDVTLIPFVSSLVYYSTVTVALVAALSTGGVEVTSFIAVLGAAGLAIGLAFKDTLSNFASGVMLLTFRPFRAGDYVEVAEVGGTVTAVHIFHTVLNTPDNVQIVVPNSSIWGDEIKNYNANATRRVDLVVGIAYDDDIATAIEIIEHVLGEDERVLADPAPVVAVHELGASSVDLVVRPWCQTADYWPLRWSLTRRIKEQLEAGGCSIPFPQRDVHLYRAQGEEPAQSAAQSAA